MVTPPMIHPSLLVNTPVQSFVPRCLVLESESFGIYGVFCTSCTCLPDFLLLYIIDKQAETETRFWFWILSLSNYHSFASLHTIRGKDSSFSENKHASGMLGLLATTLNRGVAYLSIKQK